jgi:hypothetical protein
LPFQGNASHTIPAIISFPMLLCKTGITNLHSHRVDVDFLIKVVEKSNGLHYHGIHLVRGEFEFKTIKRSEVRVKCEDDLNQPRKRMTETQAHSSQILGVKAIEESSYLSPNTAP